MAAQHSDGEHPAGDDRRPGGARTPGAGRPDLADLNKQINDLVAARGGRPLEDLVPAVEAVMRRHGVSAPGRDGILLWIEEAVAAECARPAPPRPE
jgi:hypothetical protein